MSATPENIDIPNADMRVSGDESNFRTDNLQIDTTKKNANDRVSTLNRIFFRTLLALAGVWIPCVAVCAVLGGRREAFKALTIWMIMNGVATTVHVAIRMLQTAPMQSVVTVANTCMRMTPNVPSSATRPTRALDCNLDAMAGFAAAHG